MRPSTPRLFLLLAAPFLLCACQSATPTVSAPSTTDGQDLTPDARIERIERGLVPLDASRRESGPPRSIAERMADLHVPGLSIALFDQGRLQWARGYGVRDAMTREPVDPSTLFQAASISKPVSSVTLFRLVEQGTLTLDEDVNDRLRSWKVPENAFTRVEKVTPRRIVTHMAGLTGHGFGGYAQGEALPTVQQILDGTPPANSRAVRVDTIPGTLERYSGGGFMVLQLLMEEASGRPFMTLADEAVLQPAGMRDSTFSQPLPAALADRAAAGHTSDGARLKGRYHTYPELAAAGLWTTPSDLARFMLAVGHSYRGEPDGLLNPSSARTMLTKVPGGDGQGFDLARTGDALRYSHAGGNAGFRCYAVAFAGTSRGVVLMTNADEGDRLVREVTRAIAREYGWPTLRD
ncbi:serine hydrolase domain-containing protein [Roseateles sp.]|uniref:serine hydrolase domain-containing protein n=1 Tax=Roseateles sp. TaxID=1971397 RepID=UPI002F402859